MKVVISDRVWVDKEHVKKKHVKPYDVHLYNEDKCIKCPNLPDRPNYVCESCEHYGGLIKTWKLNKDRTKVGFPVGCADEVLKQFEDTGVKIKVIDKRVVAPAKRTITFTSKLYEGQSVDGIEKADQVSIVKKWFASIINSISKRGFLESRPRSGKTIMGSYIACKLKQRTLILAHNEELLQNFYKTFVGDTNRKPMTDATKDEVVIVRKDSDFEKATICLSTYQKFIGKNGAKRIRKYAKKFGFVIIDEAHQSGANAYAKLLSRLKPKYLLALSATPERKDGRIILAFQVLGGVKAVGDVGALLPRIELLETGEKPKTEYKMWTSAMQFLARSETRNRLIVKQVFADLRNGQNSILIPVDFKNHMHTLVKMINKQAKINNKKRGEDWPTQLAVPFSSDTPDRKWTLDKIRNNDHKVTIAIRSMVKQGLDVDIWDTLYMVVPMNNNAMFYQLINRICNPYKNKKPICRIFVDNMGPSLGCFKSSWFRTIIPGLKKRYDEAGVEKAPLYKITSTTFRRAMDIAKTRNYVPQVTDPKNPTPKDSKPTAGFGKYTV